MAVGISLDLNTAPGATPITPNATSAKTFASNYYKLAQGNISTRDRNAIAILGLIYELTNAGGANYKANHKGLIQDSVVYTGAISLFDQGTARAANSWNAGKVADATLSSDIPTLLGQAPHIADLAEDQQERIIAFLRAQLRT